MLPKARILISKDTQGYVVSPEYNRAFQFLDTYQYGDQNEINDGNKCEVSSYCVDPDFSPRNEMAELKSQMKSPVKKITPVGNVSAFEGHFVIVQKSVVAVGIGKIIYFHDKSKHQTGIGVVREEYHTHCKVKILSGTAKAGEIAGE